MPLIATLIISILVSYVFMALAKKLHSAKVIGLIFAGLFLGATPLKEFIVTPHLEAIYKLGDIGFYTLMFVAGLEVSWSMLYREKKDAFLVAISGAIVPFLLGFLVFLALGFPVFTAMAVGIAMSISAEATRASILLEFKKLKTKIGTLMMGAGILDDIIGLMLFTILSYLVSGEIFSDKFFEVMIALGIFALGMSAHRFVGREKHFIAASEKWIFILLIPFFFIGMGTKFSFESLIIDPWITGLILLLAFSGKMISSLLTKFVINDLSWKQLYLIGWSQNSRGSIEIAICFIAFEMGILTEGIYSAIILMVLTTTIVFPIIVRKILKEDPQIMDR